MCTINNFKTKKTHFTKDMFYSKKKGETVKPLPLNNTPYTDTATSYYTYILHAAALHYSWPTVTTQLS